MCIRDSFEQRIGIMKGEDVSETVDDMRHQVIDDLITKYMPPNTYAEQWETAELRQRLREAVAIDFPIEDWAKEEGIADEEIRERVRKAADELYQAKREKFTPAIMQQVEKAVVCLLYTSPSPRDRTRSRMPSSA